VFAGLPASTPDKKARYCRAFLFFVAIIDADSASVSQVAADSADGVAGNDTWLVTTTSNEVLIVTLADGFARGLLMQP